MLSSEHDPAVDRHREVTVGGSNGLARFSGVTRLCRQFTSIGVHFFCGGDEVSGSDVFKLVFSQGIRASCLLEDNLYSRRDRRLSRMKPANRLGLADACGVVSEFGN